MCVNKCKRMCGHVYVCEYRYACVCVVTPILPCYMPAPPPTAHPHQALTLQINEVEDRLGEDLSRRIGVANIREWEEQHAAFEEEASTRRNASSERVRAHDRCGCTCELV